MAETDPNNPFRDGTGCPLCKPGKGCNKPAEPEEQAPRCVHWGHVAVDGVCQHCGLPFPEPFVTKEQQ
jgi:hypothetical protein